MSFVAIRSYGVNLDPFDVTRDSYNVVDYH